MLYDFADKLSEDATLHPFIVTFGGDDGDAETGPHLWARDELVYARSENEACRKGEKRVCSRHR